jgi:hypothetical protein
MAEHTNYAEHGAVVGRIQTDEQVGDFAAGVYASTKGSLPLLHITAEIAVLPFGGGASAGKFGLRLILKEGAKAGGKTLLQESAKAGIDYLAGKEVNLSKRGREIVIDVAASALVGAAGVAKDKFIGDLSDKYMKFETDHSRAVFEGFLGDLYDSTVNAFINDSAADMKRTATNDDDE